MKPTSRMTAKKQKNIISGYARMWPREVYDLGWGKGAIAEIKREVQTRLGGPGVYVLYRDD